MKSAFVALLLISLVGSLTPSEDKMSFLDEDISFSSKLLKFSHQTSRDLLPSDVPIEHTESALQDLVQRLKVKLAGLSEPEILPAFNDFFFVEEGFKADRDDPEGALLENLLIEQIVDRRMGACLGLAVVYLSLADQLELPIYGVAAPSHFFLRYVGETMWNIEMLEQGKLYTSDTPFKERYYIREGEPFYLESLGSQATLGVYLTSLAAHYIQRKHYSEAVEILKHAQTLNPEDVETTTNLGNAYLHLGRADEAITMWLKAVEHNRYDDKAHYNLALVFESLGRYDLAIHHYDQSLLLGHDVNHKLLRALEPHRSDSYVKKKELSTETP